jgi:biopolymer transport protein ExbB
MSLIRFFQQGGPVMWPLLVCSLVALAITIERAIHLRGSRILDPRVVERVTGLAEAGGVDRAIEACREQPGMFSHIVMAGLEVAASGERESVAKEAIEDAGRHETVRLHRYLGALSTIVGISPLLGLFGTVTGMIEVFHTIAQVGAGQADALAGGISQALITTATGLAIAIPGLVSHNYYHGKAQAIVTDLESAALRALRGVYRAPQAVEG